jgi:hypothetical protein
VFVAAGFNPGSHSARLVEAVRHGRLRMVGDDATHAEIEQVMRQIPRLSWTRIADLFRSEDRFGGSTHPEAFGFVPDRADRKFAALADAVQVPQVTSDARLLNGGSQMAVPAFVQFDVLRPVLEDHVPLATLARELHLPRRTLQRWLARYRPKRAERSGTSPRADRGQSRLRSGLREAIEGLALQRPRRSPASIWRQVASIARERGWVEPTYRQVHSVIRQLDPALVTLAHHGTRAYSERFELLHRREASRPNEIWQADHTPLDIWLLDEHGLLARALLTNRRTAGALGLQPGHDCAGLPADPVGVGPALGLLNLV